jgi:hypothetical protein
VAGSSDAQVQLRMKRTAISEKEGKVEAVLSKRKRELLQLLGKSECVHMYTCAHAQSRTHVHRRMHTHIYKCTHVRTHKHFDTSACTFTYTHIKRFKGVSEYVVSKVLLTN